MMTRTYIQKQSWFLRTLPLKKEYLSIIISLMLFALAPVWLRLVDETAAPLDVGVLSAILVAILAFLLLKHSHGGLSRIFGRYWAISPKNNFMHTLTIYPHGKKSSSI